MSGARSAMFCSPHPYGICSSPSRFSRARPRRSPAQKHRTTETKRATNLTFTFYWGFQVKTVCSYVIPPRAGYRTSILLRYRQILQSYEYRKILFRCQISVPKASEHVSSSNPSSLHTDRAELRPTHAHGEVWTELTVCSYVEVTESHGWFQVWLQFFKNFT